MRATLRDVAERAGVSTATVSMVLRDLAEGRVSEETSARVRAAAASLNYVSNGHAASLRTKRTPTVGFISDRIATTGHAVKIIRAASDTAREYGYTLLMVNSGEDPADEAEAIKELRRDGIDSVVYARMEHQRVTLPAGLPDNVVIVDGVSDDQSVPATVPDESQGAEDAIDHLVALGHRRIGLLNEGVSYSLAARLRLQGYQRALERHGLDLDPALVVTAKNSPTAADIGAAELLDQASPTAILCFNDEMATGVYRVARRRGLSIPNDLSVVGFDNLELVATLVDPPLTTVRLPHEEMGEWAVRTLLDDSFRTHDHPPGVPTRQAAPLVIRHSTAPPSARRAPLPSADHTPA